MTQILIQFLLFFQVFMAGSFFQANYNSKYPVTNRIIIGLATALVACLYIPLTVIIWFYSAIEWLFGKLDEFALIRFWFKFYFTNRWKNLTDDELRKVNSWGKNWNKDFVSHRIKRKAVQVVNKRHSYTYSNINSHGEIEWEE